jgi:copper chaperone CopZ
MATIKLIVPDISCEGCASAITQSVSAMTGVEDVEVELGTKRVTVNYDSNILTPENIRERLDDIGYTPEPPAG